MRTRAMRLSLMEEAWKHCPEEGYDFKYEYARMIAEQGGIPLVHIAKCVGVTVTSLKRQNITLVVHLSGDKPVGGKFHPEAISTLRALERSYTLNKEPSLALLRIARRSCSFGVISTYTGYSETKLRNALGE